MRVVVIARAADLMGNGFEKPPWQRIALRMMEFNGSDSILAFVLYETFRDFPVHTYCVILVQPRRCTIVKIVATATLSPVSS